MTAYQPIHSDCAVVPPLADARSELERVLELTGRIEAGTDPFAAFVSVAKVIVPEMAAECVVELVTDGAELCRAAVTDDGSAVAYDNDGEPLASTRSMMRSAACELVIDDIVAVPVVSSIALEPYIGALTCVSPHRPPAELASLMRLLVARTIDMVAGKRLSQALASERSRTHNLESALDSNREIGMAMGIIMARLGCTREDAFDRLRQASQDGNRKLRDIAAEVVLTGTFEPPPATAKSAGHPASRTSVGHRDAVHRDDTSPPQPVPAVGG